MVKSNDITATQVIDFLNSHPDFFTAHPDIVDSLTISHESGKAISLIERQLHNLRVSNSELKTQINQLLDVARTNENHFEHTKQFTLALLALDEQKAGLDDLIDLFNDQFPSLLAAHSYRLVFLDAPFISQQDKPLPKPFINIDEATLKKSAPKLNKLTKSYCGSLQSTEQQVIFGEEQNQVNSFALIPLELIQYKCVICAGNTQHDYFYPGMGTVFLDFIQAVSQPILNTILERHFTPTQDRQIG